MDFHPLANLFPLMEGTEFDELVEDIRKHGLREPIAVYEGKILDGRNRYRACKAADVTPKVMEADCGDDPVAFVVSKNLHRRHLSPSQVAMVGGRIANLQQGDNRFTVDPPKGGSISQASAARLTGASERSIQRARVVLKKGDPALVQAVEAGQVPVRRAAELAQRPHAEQRQALSEPKPRQQKADCGRRHDTNGKPGKGVILANEAINCLIRIPKNDPLRERGFQIVMDWIKAQRKAE